MADLDWQPCRLLTHSVASADPSEEGRQICPLQSASTSDGKQDKRGDLRERFFSFFCVLARC